MTMKSVLLGTAAAVVATSAFAADATKTTAAAPAAASYVKVCDSFGAGYFVLPGSETCLKISGRIRENIYYNTNTHKGVATSDGRVEFATAQATEFGAAKSAIRFDYNGKAGDSTVSAGEAWISVGDFYFGMNLGELYQFANFGGYGVDNQGVNILWNPNAASSRLNLDDDKGTALRYYRDFGGGLKGGAEIVGKTASGLYTFAPYSKTSPSNPVIEAEVSYDFAPFTAKLGGAYDTAPNAADGSTGGYGVNSLLEYKVSPALKGGLGLGYTKYGSDKGQFHVQVGGQYDIDAKWQVYANGLFSTTPSGVLKADNKVSAEVGAQYTIAKNLFIQPEEQLKITAGNSVTWTSYLRLKRSF